MRASPVFARRIVSGYVVLSMLLAFFLFIVPPAHATAVVNNSAVGGTTTGSSFTVALTVSALNDLIVVNIGTQSPCTSSCQSAPDITATILDDKLTVYKKVTSLDATCPGSCVTTNGPRYITQYYGLAGGTGTDTITVTLSGTVSGGGTAGADAVDVNGATSALSVFSTGSCESGFCTPVGVSPPVTSDSNGFGYVTAIGFSCGTFSSPGGWTFQSSTNGDQSQYSVSVTSPSDMHFTTSATCTAFAVIGAIWEPAAATTSTTTNNIQCVGACTGTPSGTNYIVSKRLYFAQAVNGVSVSANLYNITSNINHVHVTTATASFTLAVYSVPGGNPPSASNPFLLLFSLVFSITNSSDTGQVITAAPNVLICASCSYAVALYTNANTSRGSGSSNSGISVPTSGLIYTQFFFNVGSGTHVVPTSFFSSSTTTPALYLKGLSNFAVVSQTTTTTVTGAVSTTVTVTSVTLDAALAAQGTASDAIILLMILFPAMALMIPIAAYTKSAPAAGIGFVAGAMIGAGAGVQANIVPPVFLGVILIVGIFIMVGLWKTGGP